MAACPGTVPIILQSCTCVFNAFRRRLLILSKHLTLANSRTYVTFDKCITIIVVVWVREKIKWAILIETLDSRVKRCRTVFLRWLNFRNFYWVTATIEKMLQKEKKKCPCTLIIIYLYILINNDGGRQCKNFKRQNGVIYFKCRITKWAQIELFIIRPQNELYEFGLRYFNRVTRIPLQL